MELEEVLPEAPTFTLHSTGKEYRLRLVNLEDHVWLQNRFGGGVAFSKILEKQDWGNAILFAYRLMIDKTDFMAVEETVIDDDGVEKRTLITGPLRLLRAISGAEEATLVMAALAKSIMLSNPTVDKYVKAQYKEDQKKSLTGQTSSTRSQVNTDGRPTQ